MAENEHHEHQEHDHKYHGHGPLIYDVYQKVDALPLHAPYDKVEKERQERMTKQSIKQARHIRQSLNIFVGVAVGLCFVFLDCLSEYVADFRKNTISRQLNLMGETKFTESYGYHALFAMLLALAIYVVCAFVASVFTAWEPRCSSSGIPQIIAFLNGVNQKGVLEGKVLIAKFCGTIFSFGGGLCLGPEGPMIHLGAILGLMVTRRVVRPALRCFGAQGRKMEEELSRCPLRYDIQAGAMGAGAGVAAAFQAPLAGTMFVVEEASSFFSVKLFFHTFITCAFAVFVTMVTKAAFGKDLYIYYSRNTSCLGTAFSLETMLAVFVVAVACTLLALIFNNIIVWCNTQRALQNRRLQAQSQFNLRFVRMGEVALLAVITALCVVWLPAFSPCQDASMQSILSGSGGCVSDSWRQEVMLTTVSQMTSKSSGWLSRMRGTNDVTLEPKYIPHADLFGVQYDPVQCPIAIKNNSACNVTNSEFDITKHIPADKVDIWKPDHYCCGFSSSGTILSKTSPVAPLPLNDDVFLQGTCPKTRFDEANGAEIQQYNAGYSLWLVLPEAVLKTLLTRGGPGLIPLTDLSVFLGGYSLLTALTAGVWVPGGLLVPQLVIGASAGRVIGEIWVLASGRDKRRPHFAWAAEFSPVLEMLGISYDPNEVSTDVAVLDPGVFALAGAAAFLAASGSLALFVVVLVLEITFDWMMTPVVVLAVLVARVVTTFLGSHGLYHRLIDVASLPFLDEHTHWRLSRWTANDVLQEDLRHAQRLSRLAGDEEPGSVDDILLFIRKAATAQEVQELLHRKIPGNPDASPHAFPVVESDGELCGLVTREALTRKLKGEISNEDGDEMPDNNVRHVFSTAVSAVVRRSLGGSDLESPVGVADVMDTAPFVVQPSTPVHQIHMMFRQLGLRHVVVVDAAHRPHGMLTRKSLMPWRCPQESGVHDSFAAIRHAREPAAPLLP